MRRFALLAPPLLAVAFVSLFLATAPLGADDNPGRSLVDTRTLAAVDAGLRFLVRTQNPDGSWSSNAGKKINDEYRVFPDGQDIPHVGVTSLAILAFLAGGHVPGRGPFGDALDRAVDFVLSAVQTSPSGYITAHGTRMYSHAFATLALAEVYGVTRNERVRTALTEAVEFTRKSQNQTGGWRYVPFTQDSDMSVTVCQVVALRAARNVGIKVPRATIDRALHYVIESAVTDQPPRGAFLYQPQEQRFNRDSFALTAAGLTTLFQAGLYDDRALAEYVTANRIPKDPAPRVGDCVTYMRRTYYDIQRRFPDHYFFYYGSYYATQAMYQVGGKDPETWASWYRQVRDDLLSRMQSQQGPRGERETWWVSNVDRTNAYGTATALLILQFPLDQLPIHQR
jgi:hypothetical protein